MRDRYHQSSIVRNRQIVVMLLIFASSSFGVTGVNAQTPTAVIEFEHKGVEQAEASALTDRLRDELFRTGEFKVIEREKMDKLLDEQGFQMTGCTEDLVCVARAGRILNVSQIVVGSVSKLGDTYTISARLVNVETAEIIRPANFDHRGNISGLLVGMKNIATDLIGRESPSDAIDHATEREPSFTRLEIKVDTDANIQVGKYSGYGTSATFELAPGSHYYSIVASGYESVDGKVRVGDRDTVLYVALLETIAQNKSAEALDIESKGIRDIDLNNYNIGLFVGYGLATRSYSDFADLGTVGAMSAGVSLRLRVSSTFLIQTGLGWTQRGLKIDDISAYLGDGTSTGTFTATYHFNHLEIPLVLVLSKRSTARVIPEIEIGPSLAIFLSGTSRIVGPHFDNSGDADSKTDLGLIIGAHLRFGVLRFGVRYVHGLLNLGSGKDFSVHNRLTTFELSWFIH